MIKLTHIARCILSIVAAIMVFNLALLILNSVNPAVTLDSYNHVVKLMPVANMLWSLFIAIISGILLLIFMLKRIKKKNEDG